MNARVYLEAYKRQVVPFPSLSTTLTAILHCMS